MPSSSTPTTSVICFNPPICVYVISPYIAMWCAILQPVCVSLILNNSTHNPIRKYYSAQTTLGPLGGNFLFLNKHLIMTRSRFRLRFSKFVRTNIIMNTSSFVINVYDIEKGDSDFVGYYAMYRKTSVNR